MSLRNRVEWDNIPVKGLKQWMGNSFCKVFKMGNITCYNIAELKSMGVVGSPYCHCMIQWSLLSQNTEPLIGLVMRCHTNRGCGLHSSLLWFIWNTDFCYKLETQLTKVFLHYQKNKCGDNCSMLFKSNLITHYHDCLWCTCQWQTIKIPKQSGANVTFLWQGCGYDYCKINQKALIKRFFQHSHSTTYVHRIQQR